MYRLFLRFIVFLFCINMVVPAAAGEGLPSVMFTEFQLDDRTGLPDPPEELARIQLLTETFEQMLAEKGVKVIPANDELKNIIASQSSNYLYDHPDLAASTAKASGVKYLIIAVAFKPTYLFVYPRLLLVDVNTGKVMMSKSAQLESSWTDKGTTINMGKKLAQALKDRIDQAEQE
ncbi:DUF2380 domain-containing protein [Methylobacillus arboreus]|uniref:DUF2380 domain-containing protein n=1 Tax=Methylobacillus arboreus TaxID=755170 RepID=UPI001E573958|nr:DUF2380 domain-containing protein [Methylobacillus arboreus]MCB5191527.1 DUF2380 domain-containing protein [Methylobacillus arboreus]